MDLLTLKLNQLRKVTLSLLDSRRPAHSLQSEILEITKILADSSTNFIARQEDTSYGEIRTMNGLSVSPTIAAMCANDFIRTVKFIRGAHDAIVDSQKRFPDRPVRVLYVGCGPYATLAVPLMMIFSANEVTFKLLDLHLESIESAESIVTTLELADSVTGFETVDASSYHICPKEQPDVILMEIMQACLESEPQVAIARHLLHQASNAILIPEEIRVDLILVDPSQEFDLKNQTQNESIIQDRRVPVSSVFVLNQETVASWKDNHSNRLPALVVRIPDPFKQWYQPLFFMTVRIYNNHILKEYESGLTYPRALSIECSIKPGDTMQFHYELGSHPRINGEVSIIENE